jgi:hypothetical protein
MRSSWLNIPTFQRRLAMPDLDRWRVVIVFRICWRAKRTQKRPMFFRGKFLVREG